MQATANIAKDAWECLLAKPAAKRLLRDMAQEARADIAQADRQAVRAYRSGLLNQLFQEHVLGNLIRPEDCQKVKFGDVVKHVKVHFDPDKSGLEAVLKVWSAKACFGRQSKL